MGGTEGHSSRASPRPAHDCQASPIPTDKTKMQPRCLLQILVLCLLLEEVSAFLLPDGVRQDAALPDADLSLLLPEHLDPEFLWPLVAEETASEGGIRRQRPSPFRAPLKRISSRPHSSSRKRNKGKRRRVSTPIDSIGTSVFSSHKSQKDDPEDYWEYYTDAAAEVEAHAWGVEVLPTLN